MTPQPPCPGSPPPPSAASSSQAVRELGQEVPEHAGHRQPEDTAAAAALLGDALPAQLLQRGHALPVRRAQAALGRRHVVLQQLEEPREAALAARQAKALVAVHDAHADGARLRAVRQSEEHVLLPAVPHQVAAQRCIPQHAVGLLHAQRAPVEAAALQLRGGVRDDAEVLLRGEGREVGGEGRAGPGFLTPGGAAAVVVPLWLDRLRSGAEAGAARGK